MTFVPTIVGIWQILSAVSVMCQAQGGEGSAIKPLGLRLSAPGGDTRMVSRRRALERTDNRYGRSCVFAPRANGCHDGLATRPRLRTGRGLRLSARSTNQMAEPPQNLWASLRVRGSTVCECTSAAECALLGCAGYLQGEKNVAALCKWLI